jgi:hypothetical protein
MSPVGFLASQEKESEKLREAWKSLNALAQEHRER